MRRPSYRKSILAIFILERCDVLSRCLVGVEYVRWGFWMGLRGMDFWSGNGMVIWYEIGEWVVYERMDMRVLDLWYMLMRKV